MTTGVKAATLGSISNHISENKILENKKVREILNKARKATLRELTGEDVKNAFRFLALKYHPDKQADKSDEEKKIALEDMKKLNDAREMLEKYLKDRVVVDVN
ncbi:hypothetical protein AGMMS50233_05440 [Endomicrobiia bacterium]|nr:hypothetical protein AGMMS50233_05440 [Endomicrobiia bacterium]